MVKRGHFHLKRMNNSCLKYNCAFSTFPNLACDGSSSVRFSELRKCALEGSGGQGPVTLLESRKLTAVQTPKGGSTMGRQVRGHRR